MSRGNKSAFQLYRCDEKNLTKYYGMSYMTMDENKNIYVTDDVKCKVYKFVRREY